MELNVYDYVMFKPEAKVGEGSAKRAKDENWLLNVGRISGNDLLLTRVREGVLMESKQVFYKNSDDLVKITRQQAETIIKERKKEHVKKCIEFVKNNTKKHVSILNSKVEHLSEKNKLFTRANLVISLRQGTLKSDNLEELLKSIYNGRFPTISRYNYVECCSFTKAYQDNIMYIPKSWLNYFGYNLTDLKNWIKYLTNSGINYNGVFNKTLKIKDVFANSIPENYEKYSDLSSSSICYLNPEEDCYEILFPCSGNLYQNYFNFLVTRFIYSSLYWNIPKIAMKLKKHVKTSTHWECLILAHNFGNYSGYYSLFNAGIRAIIPTKHNSYLEMANKFMTARFALNNSWINKETNNQELYRIRQAIESENYKELENLIKEYRNVD